MQTKVIGGGLVNPGVELGIDPTFQAARVRISPFDYAQLGQVLGHYRASVLTASIVPGANAVLFNMRWADPSRYFVLLRLAGSVTITVATTVAQRVDPLVATVQRAYTANETTSITAITLSGNSQKARANMGSSLVTQMAVASAAAGITGGTKTADANPFATLDCTNIGQTVSLGAGGRLIEDFSRFDTIGAHPQMFSANEGFTVSWGATAGANSLAVVVGIHVAWAEVVSI